MSTIGRYTNKSCYIGRRRKLRTYCTEAERRFWQKIRREQLGIKFRRQYNIDCYIVDFYCHELKLIIELDGYIHGNDPIIIKDKIRQKYLENQGYKIIRYRNEQIKYELDNVITNLIFEINKIRNNNTG